MKVEGDKTQKLPRKLRKIIVEKKRRERIDNALKQIKDMLFGTSELQNDYMKMEKADILENVVKYLHSKPQTNASNSNTTSHVRYNQGYTQCVREVTRVMEHLCGGKSQIAQSLTHYLNAKVATLPNKGTSEHPFVQQSRNVHHHHQPKAEEILRASNPLHVQSPIPSGLPSTDARVPPFHASPNSAFHRVPKAANTNSALDNISIAVYQYNHYNNFKNDKQKANAESNINIHPVVHEKTYRDTSSAVSSQDTSCNVSAKSNINIQSVIKREAISKQRDNSPIEGSRFNDNLIPDLRNKSQDIPNLNSSMWRPW